MDGSVDIVPKDTTGYPPFAPSPPPRRRPAGAGEASLADVSVPASLQSIVDTFQKAPRSLKLPLLLEYAGKVPPLPAGMDAELERVHECQTPLFLKAEASDDIGVRLYFDAPEEAPTTRGFAGVLYEGLSGASVEEVLATPDDFYQSMGLAELISPLRLRGMGAILARVKRQLREGAAARRSAPG
jgi:cysteine desulfuration protein SufE